MISWTTAGGCQRIIFAAPALSLRPNSMPPCTQKPMLPEKPHDNFNGPGIVAHGTATPNSVLFYPWIAIRLRNPPVVFQINATSNAQKTISGLFTTGKENFSDAFATMLEVEDRCRNLYFEKIFRLRSKQQSRFKNL